MRETVKISVREKIPKIEFTPSNDQEMEHLTKLKELLYQKRYGDWDIVAEKMGCSAPYAVKSFIRVYSKRHLDAVSALDTVIEERINRLNQNKNEKEFNKNNTGNH
ncbi:hypothetical protein CMU23_01565 [Elizabethkingia anophelis]|nr:hypothetical protein [Elizabethkingia anophelis]MDV3830521.1 hypothetical protein [Elizabethkingia anophelis]